MRVRRWVGRRVHGELGYGNAIKKLGTKKTGRGWGAVERVFDKDQKSKNQKLGKDRSDIAHEIEK